MKPFLIFVMDENGLKLAGEAPDYPSAVAIEAKAKELYRTVETYSIHQELPNEKIPTFSERYAADGMRGDKP